MKAILDISVLILTILMMVSVGTQLESRQFRDLARMKCVLFLVLASQVFLPPAVALALTRFLDLPPHLAAGLLLVAACPVGSIASFYTVLARGNAALSLAANTLSCLLSVLTMVIVFGAYERLLGMSPGFAAPSLGLVLRLALIVAAPVVVGMGWRHWEARSARRWGGRLQNICLGGVVLLLSYVMVSQREQVAADWRHMVLAMAGGLAVARALRLRGGDAVTVVIVFAVRNVGVATAIAVALLNRVDYAVFGTVYFLTEVPLLLGVVALYGHWTGKTPTGIALVPATGSIE
jgi:bile acid:Na+ symporter, BASS family